MQGCRLCAQQCYFHPDQPCLHVSCMPTRQASKVRRLPHAGSGGPPLSEGIHAAGRGERHAGAGAPRCACCCMPLPPVCRCCWPQQLVAAVAVLTGCWLEQRLAYAPRQGHLHCSAMPSILTLSLPVVPCLAAGRVSICRCGRGAEFPAAASACGLCAAGALELLRMLAGAVVLSCTSESGLMLCHSCALHSAAAFTPCCCYLMAALLLQVLLGYYRVPQSAAEPLVRYHLLMCRLLSPA